ASMEPVISHRARSACHDTVSNPMWDVLNDAWCPSTNPTGYINVGVAENALMQDDLLDFINTTNLDLPSKYLTYNQGGGGSSRLKRAMCGFLNRHLHPVAQLDPEHLMVTNGVSPAIEHVSWAFADPGEGILLGRPYYGIFVTDISMRPQARVVAVNFDGVDPFSIDITHKYEQALLDYQQNTGKKVRGLMLCNPHNPLGRCYPRNVIIRLMQLCQKYRIHLISDESYALSVWENTVDQHPPPIPFESVLSIELNGIIDPRLVHVLWGMSKDFGANGVRLGVIISQANRDFHLALKGPCIYSHASGITDHLVSLLLENTQFTDSYIQQNQKKLSESYAYAVGFMRQHGIEYAPGCNAAFFMWLNLGKIYRKLYPEISENEDVGEKVMQQLLEQRVCLTSGATLGSEQDGWFRIVFSHPRAYLNEALQRIIAALKR
ncbi:unnamed protein product, partial [Penicillium viridicatum]